jgi:hypothetical protein
VRLGRWLALGAAALAVVGLLVRPARVTVWRTAVVLSVPIGPAGVTVRQAPDGRRYGPPDFFVDGRRLYILDAFGGRVLAYDLATGREVRRYPVPTTAVAAALVGGRLVTVDGATGDVRLDRTLVGRVPAPADGVLQVEALEPAGALAYLLVRRYDLGRGSSTLYLVASDGLRPVGRDVDGIAAPPGDGPFWFVRQGRVFRPNGQATPWPALGDLVGVTASGTLAFFQPGGRQNGRVVLLPGGRTFSLPVSAVVFGTRVRLLPDGDLLWTRARAERLEFLETRPLERWRLLPRF